MPNINLRVSDEDKATVEKAAEAAGLSVSDWIKARILPRAPEPRELPRDGRSHKELTEEDKAQIREVRDLRRAAAERHGVAIGWIDHNGELLPGAVNMKGERVKVET